MSFRSQAQVRFFGPDGSGGSAAMPVGPVSTAGSVLPRLALASNGRALLSWVQGFNDDATVVAAERAPGANAFGEPAPVSFAGLRPSTPSLAMADAGDGAVAWTQGVGPAVMRVRGYDATPPLLGGVTIPASATVGAPADFSASPFDAWGPLTTSWSFGDGAAAAGAATQHAYARAGAYTATVTATDALGNAASQSGTVQVTVGAGVAPGEPPVLAGASLTNRRFRVGRTRTAVSAARRRRAAAAPVGTTFRFRLNQAASVRIAFAKQGPGLRGRGGRCAKPSRRLRRAGARRCTRPVAIRPALTRALPAGANAVPFSGRIGRRPLAPGRYVATLTASAGGGTSTPTRLGFRVVR